MDKLSIIIPSREEPYLNTTLKDLLKKVTGEIEIFVNIDGTPPKKLVKDKRIKYFFHKEPIGMRPGINLGLKHATGKYVMKVDAHCLFAEGFDGVLKKDMEANWLVIPRRYSLHADEWRIEEKMPPKDYHFLSYPVKCSYGYGIFPQEWRERMYQRKDILIDETMTMQGSLWFADREYFMKTIGLLSTKGYSTFSGEPLQVGLGYWLKGGKMIVNKKTWYAHLFKNKNFYKGHTKLRGYKKDLKAKGGHDWAAKHWMRNKEPNQVHSFQWLVKKFMPVPTWPLDKKLWEL